LNRHEEGNLSPVAVSLKSSASTVAALLALFGGVGVAHAGGLPGVDDPVPVVEDAVSEVDAAVADAEGEPVDEVVAEATETAGPVTETAGQVVEQVTETAENATAVVDEVVGGTPANKLLGDVERSSSTPPSGAVEAAPAADELVISASGVSISRQFGEATAGGTGAAMQPQQLSLESAPQGTVAPASVSRADDDSSNAPWPFAPLFPADTPATAAVVAGAAGAALVAALLAAFMLLAPSAGRWLRPGPTLGWPPPAVPSLERPG